MARKLNRKLWKLSSLSKVVLPALLVFLLNGDAIAQMNSNSYKIPIDSVNIGGELSSSNSYNLIDTAGEIASGNSSSNNYGLAAGFLAAQQVYLAISSPSDVNMSPSINGLTGGSGDGTSTWTVTTDNAAGYTLSIKASTSPALASAGDSFADYTPTGANPDYNWGVAATDSEFGYTVEGVDTAQRFLDNGSSCNISSSNAVDKCYDGFNTTGTEISRRTSGNHPSGTTTTVKMKAESGVSHIQEDGSYGASITVTLLAL